MSAAHGAKEGAKVGTPDTTALAEKVLRDAKTMIQNSKQKIKKPDSCSPEEISTAKELENTKFKNLTTDFNDALGTILTVAESEEGVDELHILLPKFGEYLKIYNDRLSTLSPKYQISCAQHIQHEYLQFIGKLISIVIAYFTPYIESLPTDGEKEEITNNLKNYIDELQVELIAYICDNISNINLKALQAELNTLLPKNTVIQDALYREKQKYSHLGGLLPFASPFSLFSIIGQRGDIDIEGKCATFKANPQEMIKAISRFSGGKVKKKTRKQKKKKQKLKSGKKNKNKSKRRKGSRKK